MRILFVAAVLCTAQSALAQAETPAMPHSYAGNVYALDDHRLLFREVHYLNASLTNQRIAIYQCPDGSVFARKHVRAGGDAQAPDFELDDARLGYREGVRQGSKGREVFVQRSAEQQENVQPLPSEKDSVIDAGFDTFVQRHWQELQHGDSVSIPFLVPSRMRFYEFKVKRIFEPLVDHDEMLIRLAMDSWYSFALPHIDVSYDIVTRQLLRFEGLSNIRGADGKNLNARVEFPLSDRHATVDASELAKAESVPLAKTCGAQ
jgi:hypothetical protein